MILGCCLICEDGYEGCLCLKCKCTKCDWYSGNDDDLAHETTDFGGKWCTLVDVWRNEKQEEFERGKLASDYEINDTLRVTEKASHTMYSQTWKNYITNYFLDS